MRQAEAALAFYRAFRSSASSVFNQLKLARKNGDVLKVAEQISSDLSDGPRGLRTSGSTVDTRDVDFGRLAGSTIAMVDFNPVKDLNAMLEIIHPYRFSGDDAELLELVETMTPDKRKLAASALRGSEKLFQQYLDRMNDFREFFTPDNFARLGAWADHRDAPFAFRCRVTGTPSGGRQVHFDWYGGQLRRELPAILWTPPPTEPFAIAA